MKTIFRGILILFCCSFFLFFCGKPIDNTTSTYDKAQETKGAKTKTTKLWSYLHKFVSSQEMPAIIQIEEKFGRPDNPVSDHADLLMPAATVTRKQETYKEFHGIYKDAEYYRFRKDEIDNNKKVRLTQWTYYHNDDENRQIQVFVRPEDGSIAGWMWFENVIRAEEIGPPDLG